MPGYGYWLSSSVSRALLAVRALPLTQTIEFGAKTRTGHGAHMCGYTGVGTLSIVSQKDASNATVTLFRMTQNGLNWRGAATTYNSAGPTTLNAPYTVVVQDSVTLLNSTITINCPANTFHTRELSSVANGGRWATDSVYTVDAAATTWQVQYLVETASVLTRGDTVKCRDGVFNPNGAQLMRFKPKSGAYSGTGFITIQSENPSLTTDLYGNPDRRHGASFGYILIDGGTSGNVLFPFLFKDVQFFVNTNGNTNCIKYTNTSGWGISFDNCRFYAGAGYTSSPWVTVGCQIRSAGTDISYAINCLFEELGQGILVNKSTSVRSDSSLIQNNDFVRLWSDGIQDAAGSTTNTQILDNLFRDFQANAASKTAGVHSDCYQHLGETGGTQIGANFERNIIVTNYGTSNWSCQGYFADDTLSTNRLSGVVIKNNITDGQFYNQVFMNRHDDPDVRFNTLIPVITGDINGPSPGPVLAPVWITLPSGNGGTGAVVTHNIAPQIVTTGQAGVVVSTPNAFIPTITPYSSALAQRQAMFPNYVEYGIYTRVAAKARATPSVTLVASGGAMNATGTYCGALFPNGSWNDGSIYI